MLAQGLLQTYVDDPKDSNDLLSYFLSLTGPLPQATDEKKSPSKSKSKSLKLTSTQDLEGTLSLWTKDLAKQISDYALLRPSFPNLVLQQSPTSKQKLASRNSSQNGSQTQFFNPSGPQTLTPQPPLD